MTAYTWTGAAGDNNFSDPNNWSPNGVPGASDTATISPAAALTLAVNNIDVGNLTDSKKVVLTVADNTSFTIGNGSGTATFTNGGALDLNASYYGANFIVNATKLNLSGGGTIAMGDYPANRIYAASATDTLNNVNNLIEGAGALGNGALTFVNGAAGIVDATGGNALVLNTGSATVTNSGLLEATNPTGGGLVIQSSVNDSTGGTIAAAGGAVFLQNGVMITGGTLASSGGAAIIVQNGNVTLNGLTAAVSNTGLFQVDDSTGLTVLGSLVNTGTLSLLASYYGVTLGIGPSTGTPGTVTLSGGGALLLSDQTNNVISASQAGNTLVSNNVISGAGIIGNGTTLTLVNNATIDASVSNALTLNTLGTITNNGLLEATDITAGALVITSTISNATGTILAAGAQVDLAGATIQGGLIEATSVSGSVGAVNISGTTLLDGSSNTVTTSGYVEVIDANHLNLLGNIDNLGTLALQSSYYGVTLGIGPSSGNPGTVTLSGGGTLLLSNITNNVIVANEAGNTFANTNNLIEGAGQIGANTALNVVNGATIDANQTAALYLNNTGSFLNNGLMESTNTGGLVINDVITNNGTVSAAGGNVYLQGGTIAGGTLSTSGGAAFIDNGNATLDGSAHPITSFGTVQVVDGYTLNVLGTLSNQGTLELNATYYGTNLIVTSPTLTLTGGGTIALSDISNNRIYGTTGTTVLDNINNTIAGGGDIGYGQLVLINEAAGVINANAANNALVLGQGSAAITNKGLIESTNTGGLVVTDVTINNTATGQIKAAGGNVYIQGGATLAGGVLSATSTFAFIDNSGTGTLNGLKTTGLVEITDGQGLALVGAITNTGTIDSLSTYYGVNIDIGPATGAVGTTTLSGSGTLLLSDHGGNHIVASQSGNTLLDGNLIEGGGQIGAGSVLNVINNATIDANDSNALYINTAGSFTNHALLEATLSGGGGLIIYNSVVTNTGTVAAAGGNVYLSSGSIAGGLVTSSAGGAIIASGTGTLDGSAHILTNTGLVEIPDNNTLVVLGTIANEGTIALQSGYNGANLIVASPTLTLTGGGLVSLNDNQNNRIYGASASDVLDNVDNTIEGAGQLGNGQLTLLNNALIEATGSNALVVNLGSTGTNSITGTMLATGAGGLAFENSIFTNLGLIEAQDGSNVTFENGGTLANLVNGTLTGGTYDVLSTGDATSLNIDTAAVTALAANLTLSGTGASVSTGGAALGANLAKIAHTGTLTLANGASLTDTVRPMSDLGTIDLTAGTLTMTKLSITGSGHLNGDGKVNGNIADNGNIVATGGLLNLTGNLVGTGTLSLTAHASAEVGKSLDVASTVFNSTAEKLIIVRPSLGTTTDISGFAQGDSIEFLLNGATAITYSGSTTSGTLTVSDGNSTVATLNFVGDYTQNSFTLTSNGTTATVTGTGNTVAASAHTPLPDFAPSALHALVPAAPHEPASLASGLPRDVSTDHFALFLTGHTALHGL